MKKISLFIMAILVFAGCSKLEVNKENILGTWVGGRVNPQPRFFYGRFCN